MDVVVSKVLVDKALTIAGTIRFMRVKIMNFDELEINISYGEYQS